MIKVRRGVFETNSSSSHSIVMMKNDKPLPDKVNGGWRTGGDGLIHFWGDDLSYGRSPFELLVDWYGRLCYAIASFSEDHEKLKEIEDICRKRIEGFKGFKFDKNGWTEEDDHGYVDHQSAGVLQVALKRFNISLEEFIFNDRYVVSIDGDEYQVFDTFMNTDMFNPSAIQDVVPGSWSV